MWPYAPTWGFPSTDSGKAEPCAWAAIGGVCTKKCCLPCARRLEVPADLLRMINSKCHERVRWMKQPNDPG